MRRDAPSPTSEVVALRHALEAGHSIYTTGLILQELLQGFTKPKAHKQIIKHFTAIPLLVPDRTDHIKAAELRNTCRRKGIQVGTIDALLAELCIRYELRILTTDNDFRNIATVVPLSVWMP